MAGKHRDKRYARAVHNIIRRERALALPFRQMVLVVLFTAMSAVLLLGLITLVVPEQTGAGELLRPTGSGPSAPVAPVSEE